MSDSDKFLDVLVQAVVKEIIDNNLLSVSISTILRDDRQAVESILSRINPDIVAAQLAREIINRRNSNDMAAMNLAVIMRDAKVKATDMVAEQMAAEVLAA